MNKCPECKEYNWKRSDRKHGRTGRFFVECKTCGHVAQATEWTIFDTNPNKNRTSPIATKTVSARLTECEYMELKALEMTVREVLFIGIRYCNTIAV